jgi:hypothetical protein
MSIRFPLLLRAVLTSATMRRRCGLAACMFSSAALLSGCAKQPPGSTSSIALSGKRLQVTMRFRNAVNPNFHYFFLINYDQSQGPTGNQNAPGPVPVLGPANSNQGYGNGFASGSGNSAFGFTDFVKYENNTFRLLHVVGDPTISHFVDEGQPVTFTLPNAGDPTVLQFSIDLAQIVVQPSGAAAADPTQAVAQAKAIRWLQMNIVATDVIPVNQTTIVNKQVDSLGDTRTLTGASSFLDLDMANFRSYTNQDFAGQAVFEPADNDVFGSANPDPSLDLIDYSITVVQQ